VGGKPVAPKERRDIVATTSTALSEAMLGALKKTGALAGPAARLDNAGLRGWAMISCAEKSSCSKGTVQSARMRGPRYAA